MATAAEAPMLFHGGTTALMTTAISSSAAAGAPHLNGVPPAHDPTLGIAQDIAMYATSRPTATAA